MIGVLKVRESFSHQEYDALQANCRKFVEEFPDCKSEFFYALYPSEPKRFFIIRISTTEREKFVVMVENFGNDLGFEVLKRATAENVLFRHDIDSFV